RTKSAQATVERARSGQDEIKEITAQAPGATFNPVTGKKTRDGRWIFSIGQARARSAVVEGAVLTAASASNVNWTIAGGRAQLSMDQARVERAERGPGVFNEITLRDVSASLELSGAGARE